MNCPECGRAFEALDPRLFSFNSPHGWCSHCRGFGEVWETLRRRTSIRPSRLSSPRNAATRFLRMARRVPARSAVEHASTKPLGRLPPWRNNYQHHALAADASLKSIQRLRFRGTKRKLPPTSLPRSFSACAFLCQVGLGYLTLDRAANSLSGGESQRIRLAAQLGSNLRGVLYVLDEPTIGLHARDNPGFSRR